MSKGSRTDLCGGWPERAIPTATGWWPGVYHPSSGCDHCSIEASSDRGVTEMWLNLSASRGNALFGRFASGASEHRAGSCGLVPTLRA